MAMLKPKKPTKASRDLAPSSTTVADAEKAETTRRAKLALDPAASAVGTLLAFSKGTFGEGGAQELYETLDGKVRAVHDGSLKGPEALLVSQANSLNMIFTELARRAAANMGEYIEPAERYMRLALKAQAQCRATLETLATIKNPPVVYARQANISAGHQQVNNNIPAPLAPPAANSEGGQNELLGTQNDESVRVDAGAASPTESGHPKLGAVADINGAPHT